VFAVYAWLWLQLLTSDTLGDILSFERYGAECGHVEFSSFIKIDCNKNDKSLWVLGLGFWPPTAVIL
jgi:hypothetical protein